MKAFLERLAEDIYHKHRHIFHRICVVLPSRRAGLFLKKYFSGIITQPVWLPAIYSIDDFIEQLTSKKISDPLDLLFELYEIHKAKFPHDSQRPEYFLNQGLMILSDFDSIDKSLSNAREVYTWLTKTKKIETWNPGKPELTDSQKKYLEFFESLYDYYPALKKNLSQKFMAYPGMLYREASQNLESGNLILRWEKVIFAGFNALSKSEENIIKNLINQDKAEIYWDADKYYMDIDFMEAGQYLRKYKSIFPGFQWIDNALSREEKNIQITGIPSDIGMAKLAGHLVNSMISCTDGKIRESMVIALADESLLIPLLSSLPETAGRCNVTMGYPYTNTHFHEFIKLVLDIQGKREIQQVYSGKGELAISPTDLYRFLKHPLLSVKLGPTDLNLSLNTLITTQAGFQKSAITDDLEVRQFIEGCLWPDSPTGLLDIMLQFIFNLVDPKAVNDEGGHTDIEFAATTHQILTRLKKTLERYPEFSSFKTLGLVYNQLSKSIKIPFYGEPLSGLQIMGMLETRALDFENVIILSANEDRLPKVSRTDSLLPVDIQRAFGMPTYREQASIYAYTFYRLIQKARNITIFYNAAEENTNVSEKSRFIRQIVQELPKINPEVSINETILAITPNLSLSVSPLTIEKNPDLMKLLKEKAVKGLSPTSLSTYIQCPLKFCLNELLSVREPEEIVNQMDAATFGKITHDVLNSFYQPFVNQVLNPEMMGKNLKNIGKLAQETATYLKPAFSYSHGKNFLDLFTIEKICEKIIRKDIDYVTEKKHVIITGLEIDYKDIITIPIDESTLKVVVKGKLDRVQQESDHVRIIDYKTGRIEKRDLVVKELSSLTTSSKMHKALQLAIYEWLYRKKNPEQHFVTASILPMKDISEYLLDIEIKDIVSPEEKTRVIEEQIKTVLQQIFDVSLPFAQTEEMQNCRNCEFATLCNREH